MLNDEKLNKEFEFYRKRIKDLTEFFRLKEEGLKMVNKAIEKKRASETRTTKVLEKSM